jgi:hypothetical protein
VRLEDDRQWRCKVLRVRRHTAVCYLLQPRAIAVVLVC